MDALIRDLEKWKVEGWNNHEQDAYKSGYMKSYFAEYPGFKEKILRKRDASVKPAAQRFLNALRLYGYGIWENLWYGYLTSHSEEHRSYFTLPGLTLGYSNPYWNNLPAFSSAILHFGACRDLFFVLLKLCLNPSDVADKERLGKLIKTGYRDKEEFKADLAKFCHNADPSYVKDGEDVYQGNEFRNFFAHRLRLLWSKSGVGRSSDYVMKVDVLQAIKKRDANTYLLHVFDMLQDPPHYEQQIEACPESELVRASQILKEMHDGMARFLNRSLRCAMGWI